jgi:RND family efflux transporter MFP subunit
MIRPILTLILCGSVLTQTWVDAAETEVEGISKPIRDEVLSVLVAGRLDSIKVREGDRITKGQIVLELNRQAEELEVQRRQLLADGKVEVNAAKARVEMLSERLTATQELYEQTKSVSREELAKLALDKRLAEAELEAAELQEKREVIELATVRHQLTQRTLMSPLAGVVIERFREEGETVQPHEPVLRVVDISKCYFVTHLAPGITANLTVGDKMPISFTLGSSKSTVVGQVDFLAPAADPASGLLRVRLVFENTDEKIPAGIEGKLDISGVTGAGN